MLEIKRHFFGEREVNEERITQKFSAIFSRWFVLPFFFFLYFSPDPLLSRFLPVEEIEVSDRKFMLFYYLPVPRQFESNTDTTSSHEGESLGQKSTKNPLNFLEIQEHSERPLFLRFASSPSLISNMGCRVFLFSLDWKCCCESPSQKATPTLNHLLLTFQPLPFQHPSKFQVCTKFFCFFYFFFFLLLFLFSDVTCVFHRLWAGPLLKHCAEGRTPLQCRRWNKSCLPVRPYDVA